jgi:NADH-quinone oxidoreductase subunit C
MLIDICVIDYISEKNRFELTYSFIFKNIRIFLKTNVNYNFYILSLSSLFNSAIWLEREIWDMFGIKFLLHPDLRRILTDYGFKGHPLCKNFPLTGYVELNYDYLNKNITINPIELSQNIRVFKFNNPWILWKI